MSDLGDEIKENYAARSGMAHLYDSEYSRRVDAEIAEAIKEVLDRYFPGSGTILEIGAGLGGNADIFTRYGITEDRIFLNELLEDRARIIREHHPAIKLYEGNAAEINFGRKFNCVFQSTVFTSVLKQADREKLAAKMWDLLEPGGFILWYDFIYNNPANKNVRKVDIRETKALFPGAGRHSIQKITLAPPIGRRVGKMYPLFNVPFLRSHILAVFHK